MNATPAPLNVPGSSDPLLQHQLAQLHVRGADAERRVQSAIDAIRQATGVDVSELESAVDGLRAADREFVEFFITFACGNLKQSVIATTNALKSLVPVRPERN